MSESNNNVTNAATEPQAIEPAAATPAAPTAPAQPDTKVFSEDYVKALRNESASYRTTARNYENALRKMLNVEDGAKLDNLDKRITAMQEATAAQLKDAMSKANNRLISAEIKNLDGYDGKLLSKLLDYSKITVDDDGNVTGLKEAAEEAAKEYPAVLQEKTPAKYAGGTGSAPVSNGKYTAEEIAVRKAAGLPID